MLHGGEKTVRSAQVVFVEAGVCNVRIKNSIAAVVSRMDELGFQLFDLTDLNRTPTNKALWLVEAMFAKKGGPLSAHFSSYV